MQLGDVAVDMVAIDMLTLLTEVAGAIQQHFCPLISTIFQALSSSIANALRRQEEKMQKVSVIILNLHAL